MTTLEFASQGSSPSIADISDVFPSPVPPTIATKLPTGTSKLIFAKVGFSAWKNKISKLSSSRKEAHWNINDVYDNTVRENFLITKLGIVHGRSLGFCLVYVLANLIISTNQRVTCL